MIRAIKAPALALAVGLVMLTVIASSATATTATRFAISPGGAISATPNGKLTFEAGGRNAICNVTMNGTMSTTTEPISGGAMGNISAARISECEGEVEGVRARFEAGAWRITSNAALPAGAELESVTGGLYEIRATRFTFETFFGIVRCEYEGNAGSLSPFTRTGAARYTINGASALTSSRFRKIGGPEACPSEGGMAGRFRITQQTITVS